MLELNLVVTLYYVNESKESSQHQRSIMADAKLFSEPFALCRPLLNGATQLTWQHEARRPNCEMSSGNQATGETRVSSRRRRH